MQDFSRILIFHKNNFTKPFSQKPNCSFSRRRQSILKTNDSAGRRFASLRCSPPSKDAHRKQEKSVREDWRIAVECQRAEPKRVESRRPLEADEFREAFALRAESRRLIQRFDNRFERRQESHWKIWCIPSRKYLLRVGGDSIRSKLRRRLIWR